MHILFSSSLVSPHQLVLIVLNWPIEVHRIEIIPNSIVWIRSAYTVKINDGICKESW